MTSCKNCDTPLSSKYCPNCGHPSIPKKIDAHYITHEIQHLLHYERGFLFTVRELLLRPGACVRDFILENRSRLVKPVIFLIVTSLLYSISIGIFHVHDGYVAIGGITSKGVNMVFAWIKTHYGYANILMGVLIALWVKLFFRKSTYNFFEILILLCFVMGMAMLIATILVIFQGLTRMELGQIASLFFLLYCTWAIGQFFDKQKTVSYLKSFLSYLLGTISFFVVAALVGFAADLIFKL